MAEIPNTRNPQYIPSAAEHIGTAERAKRPRIPRGWGDASLFLGTSILLFTVLAVAWGWWYPTTQLRITADMQIEPVAGTEDAGFRAFLWLLGLTGVLGLATSAWAYLRLKRSAFMLCWVTAVTAFSTWFFWIVGTTVADARYGDAVEPHPGDVISLADHFSLGVGAVVAPVLALLYYWFNAIFAREGDFDA